MTALAWLAWLLALTTLARVPDVPPPAPRVQGVRLPGGGIQPDIAVDPSGMIHVVYLAGEPAAADVLYVRSADGGATFSPPMRVNSQDGSAIATGTIRGAQVAVGRDGRVHVAWNGSGTARPGGLSNPVSGRAGAPMLYARLAPGSRAFSPQRNLITRTTDLDGGGSIAADAHGRVYVAWHAAPASGLGGEQARQVWIARSRDDGATFAPEVAVSDPATGACGCCAVRMFATPDGNAVHILYRTATAAIQRDIFALLSRDHGATFSGSRAHSWKIDACPMTSMSIAAGRKLLGAWETDGQVYFAALGAPAAAPVAPARSDSSHRRKHPRLAAGKDGSVLMVWAEGTAWGRGGTLAWQLFGPDGRPTGERGELPGVPVWSFAAVAPSPDGGFTILY